MHFGKKSSPKVAMRKLSASSEVQFRVPWFLKFRFPEQRGFKFTDSFCSSFHKNKNKNQHSHSSVNGSK